MMYDVSDPLLASVEFVKPDERAALEALMARWQLSLTATITRAVREAIEREAAINAAAEARSRMQERNRK